jgi:hypothetical protein
MKTSNKILTGLLSFILISIMAMIIYARMNTHIRADSPGSHSNKVLEVQPFHKLEAATMADIKIKYGKPRITIEGDSLVIAAHLIEWKDSSLVITIDPEISFRTSNTPIITIQTDQLDEITLTSSGTLTTIDSFAGNHKKITLTGSADVTTLFSGQTLDLHLLGSGKAQNKGKFESLNLKLEGSGDVELEETICNSGIVNLVGSGSVKVNCTDNLLINLMGSGDVYYKGSPKLQTNKLGSGEVSSF